jgi:hypothetical protein
MCKILFRENLDVRELQWLGICTAAVPLSPSRSTYITVFEGNRDQKTIYSLQNFMFQYRVFSRNEPKELP